MRKYGTDSYTVTVYYKDGDEQVFTGLYSQPSLSERTRILTIDQALEYNESVLGNGECFRLLITERIPLEIIKRWKVEMHPGIAPKGFPVLNSKESDEGLAATASPQTNQS